MIDLSDQNMLMIAHRARCVPDPENCIEGLIGLPRDVDGVEVDVRVTLDGVPVLMHDPVVDRVTDGCGKLEEYRFSELQKLTVCGTSEPPPRLINYLFEAARAVLDDGMGVRAGRDIYLDVKCDATWIGSIAREITAFPLASRVVCLVRDNEQLAAFRSCEDQLFRLGILGCTEEHLDDHLAWARRYAAEVVFVRHGADAFRKHAGVVPLIRAQGLRAGGSIINGAEPLGLARSYGCDLVLTDFVKGEVSN